MRAWLDRVVFSRAWLTFIVMVASFLVFGVGTLNLFLLLMANVELIGEHGTRALLDGAAQQFAGLIVTAIVSMLAYILFKACEYTLVHRLCDSKEDTP